MEQALLYAETRGVFSEDYQEVAVGSCLHTPSLYAINSPCNPNQLAIRVKINHQIKAPELRVITAEGENLGVITLAVALAEAQKRTLDLIEISPTATPPVA